MENGAIEEHENEGIASAVGNHVNYRRLGNNILFPYYGQEISSSPLKNFEKQIKAVDLELEVIPVNIPEIHELARLGGVLNCITWQVFNTDKDSVNM